MGEGQSQHARQTKFCFKIPRNPKIATRSTKIPSRPSFRAPDPDPGSVLIE